MVGTFADVVVADAVVKDVQGFDMQLAIDALMKVRPASDMVTKTLVFIIYVIDHPVLSSHYIPVFVRRMHSPNLLLLVEVQLAKMG